MEVREELNSLQAKNCFILGHLISRIFVLVLCEPTHRSQVWDITEFFDILVLYWDFWGCVQHSNEWCCFLIFIIGCFMWEKRKLPHQIHPLIVFLFALMNLVLPQLIHMQVFPPCCELHLRYTSCSIHFKLVVGRDQYVFFCFQIERVEYMAITHSVIVWQEDRVYSVFFSPYCLSFHFIGDAVFPMPQSLTCGTRGY